MARSVRNPDKVETDRKIGARIRERRILLGLTQQQVADMLGVTYQQQHKYEKGINRVSAALLLDFARVLQVPIMYFYEELETPVHGSNRQQRARLEIAQLFPKLSDAHQDIVLQVARSLAGA